MNKKAAVSTIIADMWAYLVFGIIAIAFFAIFRLGFVGGFAEYTISAEGYELYKMDIMYKLNLLSYLRSPVQFQGNKITAAELIAWSFNNDNYTELEGITRKVFDHFEYFEMFVCDSKYEDTINYLRECQVITKNGKRLALHRVTQQRIANINPDKPDIIVVFGTK